MVQWWGPRGFRNTIQEMDVRPGGHWRFVMHGPDGRDYPNHVVYVEVKRPERLVFKHVPQPDTPVSHEATVPKRTVWVPIRPYTTAVGAATSSPAIRRVTAASTRQWRATASGVNGSSTSARRSAPRAMSETSPRSTP